jgi:hypothetical protein
VRIVGRVSIVEVDAKWLKLALLRDSKGAAIYMLMRKDLGGAGCIES